MYGVLSDNELLLLREQLIEPFDAKSVQPSSYDVSLDDEILVPMQGRSVDLRLDDPADSMVRSRFKEYTLGPGQAILGSTTEIIRCPSNLSARVEGKSSLGRLFMSVHITAGVIDAGWDGQITLEIVNHGPWDLVLWAGMKIAQISYMTLTSPCKNPYGSQNLGSHYRGQRGPTAAFGKRGAGVANTS